MDQVSDTGVVEVPYWRNRVYVSGPITLGDQAVNVANAIDAADALFAMGYAPYCPHLTHFWHMKHPRPWEDWLSLDEPWLPCCNAMLRLPGESKGADREEALARRLGIPVYRDLGQLRKEVCPVC